MLLYHNLFLFAVRDPCHLVAVPAVERIVYSTCSVHQVENEDVVQSLLSLAESRGFQLETPFPQWQRRGFPVFAGGKYHPSTKPTDRLVIGVFKLALVTSN